MKIGIIGEGKVGRHLLKALSGDIDSTVTLLNSRTLEGVDGSHDIYLITVKDDAIEEVAGRISEKIGKYEGFTAHTSGSTDAEILRPYFEYFGVFYPLQSFVDDRELNYKEIPVFLEASSEENYDVLKSVAEIFTEKIFPSDSSKRKSLHIAAVLACNFVNFLYGEAAEILEEAGYDFKVLYPLIKETLERTGDRHPREMQTGPAARGDLKIMASHVEFLNARPGTLTIYKILSNLIYEKNKDE